MAALTSAVSRASSSNASTERRNTFFGALKGIFSRGHSHHKKGQRRLSILSTGSDSKDEELQRDLERRRNNCIAIKSARKEPPEVQELLVDCEFCNPPPHYGRDIEICTSQFTSSDVQPGNKEEWVGLPEEEWNVGFREWLRLRKWWITPTPEAVEEHRSIENVSKDRYFAIYDRMVRHTRPPKQPINLDGVCRVLHAGWIAEGSWPKRQPPEERWSDLDENGSLPESKTPQDQTPKPQIVETTETKEDTSKPPSSNGRTHVQFHEEPHPRTLEEGATPQRMEMERTYSNNSGFSLMPSRSNVSSLVSITDEEGS